MQEIKGYPGYFIDSDGNVYSQWYCKGTGKGRGVIAVRTNAMRPLKIGKNKDGYLTVMLKKDRRSHHKCIHRLLAEAFVPNVHGLPCVLHKNDKRTDNALNNLYWGTPMDNTHDSIRNGTHTAFRERKANGQFMPKNFLTKKP